MTETHEGLQNIVMHKQKISRMLERVDVRKAVGPDGVSGWTLRECRKQLIDPIQDVIYNKIQIGRRGYNDETKKRPGNDYTRNPDLRKAQKCVICFNIQDTNKSFSSVDGLL